MFYRENPTFALVLVFILIIGFLYFRRRKGRASGKAGTFRSGHQNSSQNHQIDNMIMLALLQNLMNDDSKLEDHYKDTNLNPDLNKTKKARAEILRLFK